MMIGPKINHVTLRSIRVFEGTLAHLSMRLWQALPFSFIPSALLKTIKL